MSDQDRLLILEEIARKTRIPTASLRYKRHRGEIDCIFRLGRRLVAYEHEVDLWIAEQRAATQRSA